MVCEYSARSHGSRSGPGHCQSPPNPHHSWNTLVYKSKLIKLIPSGTANIADKNTELLFPSRSVSVSILTTLPVSAHPYLSLSFTLFFSLSLSLSHKQIYRYIHCSCPCLKICWVDLIAEVVELLPSRGCITSERGSYKTTGVL